jgi:hypothetical protein
MIFLGVSPIKKYFAAFTVFCDTPFRVRGDEQTEFELY